MTKQELRYTARVHQVDRSKYRHFTIDLYIENYQWSRVATFRWQGDPNNKRWYGLDIEVSADNYERFQQGTKAVASVMRTLISEGLNRPDPNSILERLYQMKAVECKYDPRFSDIIPLDELAPEALSRWYVSGLGISLPSVVMAVDTEEAQTLIRRMLAEDSADVAKLEQFLADRQPVEQVRTYGEFDPRPADDLVVIDFYIGSKDDNESG